jgi:hypothetical protein
MFDLIEADEDKRRAALNRHRELLAASHAALRRVNKIWAQTGLFAPRQPPFEFAMEQARAVFRANRDATLFGPMSAGDARYAVLFLQWEARYPDEWREASRWTWSHWGRKEGVLRWFASTGVPEFLKEDVADLVLSAIQRPYRCKDWRYAALVRHVADPVFVERLSRLTDTRARFLLHVAANPDQRLTKNSWRLYKVLPSASIVDSVALGQRTA